MNTQTQTNWAIDPSHSEVEFKVKHLMITTVTGKFNNFTGNVVVSESDFTNAKISFQAQVDSISTGNSQRDEHLKSDDFFNANSFPTLTFESTEFVKENNDYKLTGNLTIRDITKTIQLHVAYNGTATDPYGNVKSGFELSGKINRKDFNLNWSATTEAGGIVVSDEVKLNCNIQLIKQA